MMEEKKNVKKEEDKQTNAKSGTKSKKSTETSSKTKNNSTSNSKAKKSETNVLENKTTNKETTTSKAKNTKSKSSHKVKENETLKVPPKKDAVKNDEKKSKQSTTKKTSAKKKIDEDINVAFIESEEVEEEIDVEELAELENENLLIDQEALEEKQLEAIKNVIKKNKREKKTKANKQAKYKKILKNILLGIALTIYFLILVVGKAIVPTIEYITCLKIATIAEIMLSIIIFEISYKKDKEELFLHGLEMMTVASATLLYLHYFSMLHSKLNIIGVVIIGIVDGYYLIKSIIIALKKDKKK